MFDKQQVWLAIGLIGQSFFSARVLVQWIASERASASVIPASFWYLSVAGSLFLVAYAIHRRDPVFIAGESAMALIFVRNLVLIRRERRAPAGEQRS